MLYSDKIELELRVMVLISMRDTIPDILKSWLKKKKKTTPIKDFEIKYIKVDKNVFFC